MQANGDEVDVDPSENETRCRVELYLGGLPLNCQERDIRDYFSRFGRVSDACVKRNLDGTPKGCGFVQFELGEEVECQALLESPHKILNKVVEVKRFVGCPIKQKQLLKEDHDRSVFVKKLSADCKDEDLQRHFEKFGKIERGYVIYKEGKSRCFGVVKFYCPTSAEAALNTRKHVIKGKEVTVEKKSTKQEQQLMKDPCKSTKSGTNSGAEAPGKDGSKKELPQGLGQRGFDKQPAGPVPIVVNGIVYAPVCPAPQNSQSGDPKPPLIPSNIGLNPSYRSYLPHVPPYYPQHYPAGQPCLPGYPPAYYTPCPNFLNSMPFIENYTLQTCYYQKYMDKAKLQTGPSHPDFAPAGCDQGQSLDACSTRRVCREQGRTPQDNGCQSLFSKKNEDDYCTNFSKNMVDYLFEEKPARGPCTASNQPPAPQQSPQQQAPLKPPERLPQKPQEKPAEPKQASGFFKFFNPCSKSRNALSQSKVCPFSKPQSGSKKDREDPSDKKN